MLIYQKKKKFRPLSLKLGVSGMKDIRNTNMMMKNSSGVHTSVNRSILLIFQFGLLALEFSMLGSSGASKTSMAMRNQYESLLRVHRSIGVKFQILKVSGGRIV